MQKTYWRHLLLFGICLLLALVGNFAHLSNCFLNLSAEEKFACGGGGVITALCYYLILLILAYIPRGIYFLLRKKKQSPNNISYAIACTLICTLVISNIAIQFNKDAQIRTLLTDAPPGLDIIFLADEFELPDDLTEYGLFASLMQQTQVMIKQLDTSSNRFYYLMDKVGQTSIEDIIAAASNSNQLSRLLIQTHAKLEETFTAADRLYNLFPEYVIKLNISPSMKHKLISYFDERVSERKAFVYSILTNEAQQLEIMNAIFNLIIANADDIVIDGDYFEFTNEWTKAEYDMLLAQLLTLENESQEIIVNYKYSGTYLDPQVLHQQNPMIKACVLA